MQNILLITIIEYWQSGQKEITDYIDGPLKITL